MTASAVRERPRTHYAEMQATMNQGENPWVMERLWHLYWKEQP